MVRLTKTHSCVIVQRCRALFSIAGTRKFLINIETGELVQLNPPITSDRNQPEIEADVWRYSLLLATS